MARSSIAYYYLISRKYTRFKGQCNIRIFYFLEFCRLKNEDAGYGKLYNNTVIPCYHYSHGRFPGGSIIDVVRKVGGSRSLLRSKSRAALTSQKTSFSVLLEENQKSNSLERIFLLDRGSSDVNQKVLTTNFEYHVFEIPLSVTEFYF